MPQFISETEPALQGLAAALAKFEEPTITPELRKTLRMIIGNQPALTNLCEAIHKYSNRNVRVRLSVSSEERLKFFTLEVFGVAAYLILESETRTQSVILVSDDVIFDQVQ